MLGLTSIFIFRFGGVPSDMCWDQYGKRLAITFKNCHVLAIFQTNINSDCVNSIP